MFIALIFLGAGRIVHAADFTVSPVVVDEKAKARDIIKESFTIVNSSSHKVSLYPSVNNIDSEVGQVDFQQAHNSSDLAASLANWIEISRGVVELQPGEQKVVPYTISVNLSAVPGVYHARVSFAEGNSRSKAEDKGEKVEATVNLEVLADVKEELQLDNFTTDRIFFSGDSIPFNYQLENIGNKDVTPTGQVRIYNGKGEEVATIDANKTNESFSPDKTAQLASVWDSTGGFGKYKAFLTLNYGASQTGTIQDTVFFWVVPWKMLAGVFSGCLFAVIFLAAFFHRWLEKRQLKLAPALVSGGFEEEEPFSPEPEYFPDIAVENKRKKRKFWFFGKRDKAGEDVPEEAEAPAKTNVYKVEALQMPRPADTAVRKSLDDHPFFQNFNRGANTASGNSGTAVRAGEKIIDLKNLRKDKEPRETARSGHIIDLRR